METNQTPPLEGKRQEFQSFAVCRPLSAVCRDYQVFCKFWLILDLFGGNRFSLERLEKLREIGKFEELVNLKIRICS